MVSQTDLGSSKDCGVIVYTILNSCELDGIWTSPQTEYYGKIGTEKAHKRTSTLPDKLSGDYDFTIRDDDDQPINSGILKIVEVKLKTNPVGHTYVLIWITVDENQKERVIEEINKAIEGKINKGIEAIKKAIKDAEIGEIKGVFIGVGIKIKMGDNVLVATFCEVSLTPT